MSHSWRSMCVPRPLKPDLLRRASVAVAVVWLGTAQAFAAGGGKPESTIVNVADSRQLPTGIGRWIAGLYNESFWLYGLAVVVVMVGMGLTLGLLADRLVALLGINLGRTAHHE
jgi:hypothetical protein